jgi:hypothetical protein
LSGGRFYVSPLGIRFDFFKVLLIGYLNTGRSVQQNEIRHFFVRLNTNASATLHAFVHSEFLKRYYHVKVVLQHEGQVITAECVCKAQYVDSSPFYLKFEAVSDSS